MPHTGEAPDRVGTVSSASGECVRANEQDAPPFTDGSENFKRLRDLADELEIIADWRDDLTARTRRYQLITETIGLSRMRLHDLEDEGEAFKLVCSVLADRIRGEP